MASLENLFVCLRPTTLLQTEIPDSHSLQRYRWLKLEIITRITFFSMYFDIVPVFFTSKTPILKSGRLRIHFRAILSWEKFLIVIQRSPRSYKKLTRPNIYIYKHMLVYTFRYNNQIQ